MIVYIVRFAAFISLIGLITGVSFNDPTSVFIEIGMIIIWIFYDMPHLKRFYAKFK